MRGMRDPALASGRERAGFGLLVLLLCVGLVCGWGMTGCTPAAEEARPASLEGGIRVPGQSPAQGPTNAPDRASEQRLARSYDDMLADSEKARADFFDRGDYDSSAPEKPKQLTVEQRLEDYRVMMDILREDYPFFGVSRRLTGKDWLADRSGDEERIRAAKNDEEFAEILNDILLELQNDHVKLCGASEVRGILGHYSHYLDVNSIAFEFFLLSDRAVRDRYGLDAVAPQDPDAVVKEGTEDDWVANAECRDLVDGKIAYIAIPEMLSEYQWKLDKDLLSDYLTRVRDYPALVIDIRGNPGGLMEYWQNLLLPMILPRTVVATNWLFFRGSRYSQALIDELEYFLRPISELGAETKKRKMKLEHPEDLKDFRYFGLDEYAIGPAEDGVRYPGRIYLVVDSNVYSAAEGFASFCKSTKIATLVGERTGGDGVTLGMMYRALPNSGYVFTYTNTLGYAPDGTINDEEKTVPDIETKDPIGWIKKHEKSLER